MTPMFIGKLVRFGAVGAACAAVFFAVNYTLLNLAGLGVFLSLALTYMTTFFLGYVLQKNVAFRSTSRHGRSLPRYALLHLAGFFLVYFLTLRLGAVLPHPEVTSPLAATLLCGLFSFAVSIAWVFSEPVMPPASRT